MPSFSEMMQGLRAEGDSAYKAHIAEDWLQGRTTFGGLNAALCIAATERAVPDLPPLRSAQFTFIGPAGGDVGMTPRLLRRGKSSVFVAVQLSSEGTLATQAALTFAAARESPYSYRSRPMPAAPPPATTANFFRAGKPKFTQHFEAYVAGGQKPVSRATTPEIVLWVRHRDPEAMHTLPGLIAIGDVSPAAAYTMLATPVPASSVTWSIEIIDAAAAAQAPGDAWYLLRTAGEDVREGYSVQDMALWTQDGTLLMLARQTVAIFG
jgi:acyl-CoA thioesterase